MSENLKRPHLGLFFTYGVSLKQWKDSGLFSREVRLYNELSKRGLDISFFSYGDNEDLELGSLLNNIAIHPLYAQRRAPQNRFLAGLHSLTLPKRVSTALKEVDVFKSNQMMGAWNAALAASKMNKPLWLRCGYELYRYAYLSRASLPYRALVRGFSGWSYDKADLIQLSSKSEAEFVARTFSIKPEKIKVQMNWIDTELFKPKPEIDKNNRVLFVGRLSHEKDLGKLLLACKDSGLGIDLVGDGPERENLEQLAAQEKIDLRILGRFANDTLPDIYNSYELFVLCSKHEGNPKSLLEAMSCGLAVIGTDVVGIKEVIEDQTSGFLSKSSVQALAHSLKTLKNNPALRQKLGKKAREQIVLNNSFENYIEAELARFYSLKNSARFY